MTDYKKKYLKYKLKYLNIINKKKVKGGSVSSILPIILRLMAVLVPSIGIYSAVDYILNIYNNTSSEKKYIANRSEKTQNKEEMNKEEVSIKTPEIEEKTSKTLDDYFKDKKFENMELSNNFEEVFVTYDWENLNEHLTEEILKEIYKKENLEYTKEGNFSEGEIKLIKYLKHISKKLSRDDLNKFINKLMTMYIDIKYLNKNTEQINYPVKHTEFIKSLSEKNKQKEYELLKQQKQNKLLKEEKQKQQEALKSKLNKILSDESYYPRDISTNELGNNPKYFNDTIKINDLLEYFPDYNYLINKQKELIDELELTKEKKEQVYNMTKEIIKIRLIKKFRNENMPRFLEYGEYLQTGPA